MITTKKLQVNNQNTPFTIDMYQTFTCESNDDSMVYYYNSENDTELDYDSFDWEYDTEKVHQGLARASIDWLIDNLDENIILNISLDGVYSPKFYNYETDSYTATYEIDSEKFTEYMKKNVASYHAWIEGQSYYINTIQADDITTENLEDDMLSFYLESYMTEETREDYFMVMHEVSCELWSENTSMILIKKAVDLEHKEDPDQNNFHEQLEGARRFHSTIIPNIKN